MKNYLLPAAILLLASCGNEDIKTTPPETKDTVVSSGNGNGNGNAITDTTQHVASTKIPVAEKPEPVTDNLKKTNKAKEDSIKNSLQTMNSKTTIAELNNKPAPTIKNDIDKPFVYKFGIIPWNPDANNIPDFLTAFPDKKILIKINFDATPDDKMQTVKTKIVAALKKAGYNNISSQSLVIAPKRMPKEIHYELQREGNVVIWVPTVSSE